MTSNQYCVKRVEKTTTCSVPWPLFYRAMCFWPCSAWSMGKRGRTILSPEVRTYCRTWQAWGSSSSCFSWRSCDPSHERPGNLFLYSCRVLNAAEPRRAQHAQKTSLASLNGQMSALPPRSELTRSSVSLGSVSQVLLLLRAGSTAVTPGEAWGLVPDSSIGNAQVTQLNKWVFLTFL